MKRLIIILLLVSLSYGTALAGELIALQSVQNGKYVRAGVGKDSKLAATSSHIKGWETFELFVSGPQEGSSSIWLKSVQNGKYVRAGVGRESYLAAGSPHTKYWERFYIRKLHGGKIALQSSFNGKYVRAGMGSSSLLAAVSDKIGGWEMFKIVKVGH
jgi:hypothetical protein